MENTSSHHIAGWLYAAYCCEAGFNSNEWAGGRHSINSELLEVIMASLFRLLETGAIRNLAWLLRQQWDLCYHKIYQFPKFDATILASLCNLAHVTHKTLCQVLCGQIRLKMLTLPSKGLLFCLFVFLYKTENNFFTFNQS